MIVDSFLFFNELDILEIRLYELAPVVDQFVLVECPFTFSGKSKPLFFQDNKDRFKDYNIHHIVANFPPHVGDPDVFQVWENESYQRNCLADGPYEDNDTVMISDVDEIPAREKVIAVGADPIKYRQRFSYYYFNMIQKNPPKQEFGTVATQGWVLKSTSPQILRHFGYDLRVPEIPQGGWHLSYMGGPQKIKTKLESFSHQEFNTPYHKDQKRLKEVMKSGKDLFDREYMDFERIEVDNSFPHLIREQPERFKSYIC